MAGITGVLREPRGENQWYIEPKNDIIKGRKQPTSREME